MPWWVWLLITIFMLAMIIIGGIYAFKRGMNLLLTANQTSSDIFERVGKMSDTEEARHADSTPLFTQPISQAANRYATKHATMIRRHEAAQDRHAKKWSEWKDRTAEDYNQIAENLGIDADD